MTRPWSQSGMPLFENDRLEVQCRTWLAEHLPDHGDPFAYWDQPVPDAAALPTPV